MLKSSIFDPMLLRGHRLNNRLIVAPMTRRSATPEGVPTDEMAAYYHAFAKGGFSVIITEGTYTDTLFSQSDQNQPGLTDKNQMEGWKKVVEQVHNEGSLIIAQLMHAGALSQYHESTLAPSAIKPIGKRSTEPGGLTGAFPIPKEITESDLQHIKTGYLNAAKLAIKAGFDGVEIHAANGYLFDQFLTGYTNLRTDRYGGSISNRLNFLAEVFNCVKGAVPLGFIVGIRMSESKVNDLSYRWPGGSQTAIETFNVVAKIKPDYLHIAAEGGNWARECLYPDGLSSTGLAKKLTDVPVIANGGLHDLNLAETLIESNQADFISIGKAALANPDWPFLVLHEKPVIPFFKELIKPSLTLSHTKSELAKLKQYYE